MIKKCSNVFLPSFRTFPLETLLLVSLAVQRTLSGLSVSVLTSCVYEISNVFRNEFRKQLAATELKEWRLDALHSVRFMMFIFRLSSPADPDWNPSKRPRHEQIRSDPSSATVYENKDTHVDEWEPVVFLMWHIMNPVVDRRSFSSIHHKSDELNYSTDRNRGHQANGCSYGDWICLDSVRLGRLERVIKTLYFKGHVNTNKPTPKVEVRLNFPASFQPEKTKCRCDCVLPSLTSSVFCPLR